MITAEIISDSVNVVGDRITSWILTYPRFIHSEVMTHRVFSRNASSSRAIPIQKMIQEVKENPAIPIHWGKNQKGMQAEQELSPELQLLAKECWLDAARDTVQHVKRLIDVGVHKQVANRLLEPFIHIRTLVTATDFENFFALRAHKDAQPEFRCLAEQMLDLYNSHKPTLLSPGEWHLPFGDRMPEWILDPLEGADETSPLRRPSELSVMVRTYHPITLEERLKIVTARAARVSYNTFNGNIDPEKDFILHDSLAEAGHWSPFEHAAKALDKSERHGNFVGFLQYRKLFENENRRDPRVIRS